MQYTHRNRHSVETAAGTYQYAAALPKPCIHPLLTPGGTPLSGFEPSDHVWHRGVWFTIKFINGTNFWEEHPPYGTQQPAEPQCSFAGDGTLTLSQDLLWQSEATGPVFTERRTVTFHARAAGDATALLTWRTVLTAAQDLTLDRTPYTTWGGYGGFSFRASRELHDVTFAVRSGEKLAALTGQRHDYLTLAAKVDGGPGRTVSICCVGHPNNPASGGDGSGSPWYAKSNGGFTFFNAAFLFHGPMTLARGRSLSFGYRMACRDGPFADGEVARIVAAFQTEPA